MRWLAGAARVCVLVLVALGAPGARAQGAPAAQTRGKPGAAASAPAGAAAHVPPTNEKAARDAFERGRVFYDAGSFDQASAAFEEAYRLSGRDALLYNVYLAYRDANQPAKAAEALRGFLAKVPNIENRAQLESRLAALDAGLARERQQREAQERTQAAQAELPAPVVATQPASEPVPMEPAPRSRRFWAGVSLAAVGGALMLSSIATGALAHNREQKLKDDCPDKVCEPSLRDTADSGKRLAHTTDALLFGGLAVAAGGAALLFVFGGWEREPATPPHVTAACSNHGCMAQTTLRF